ncbi:hypothetical protein LTR86_008485 [Recurvomyces mirabilis]|nr:hypothetical protein LTR86_008485 [Recurvomyces mirabilis]
MSVARARALKGLQSTFRSTTTRATSRVSAPARTQLSVGRRYASGGGGHGHGEPTSDIPWMIGGTAVTVPACWYLWPSAHADSGHHGHDEHAEESHGEEAHVEGEEAPKEEEAPEEEDTSSQEQGEGESEEKSDESSTGKTPKDQQEKGKAPGEDSASGKPSGSQGEGQDTGSVTPSEDSKPKEGGGDSRIGKGAIKPESDGATESRKSEPDNKGGRKTRVDSGLQKDLGASEETYEQADDGSQKEKAATSKPPAKGKEGDITGKQFGLSNTPTRHSHQIDEDPEKSKKSEGGPDTAKVMGTIDPNRPAV